MVEKGLVEVYLYSSQADKIIKGKGYQPKNLDTSDVLGILKKDDENGIADDVFGAIKKKKETKPEKKKSAAEE